MGKTKKTYSREFKLKVVREVEAVLAQHLMSGPVALILHQQWRAARLVFVVTAAQLFQAAGVQDVLNMARVGRARALLNLGDMAGAKAAQARAEASLG